MCIWHAPCYPPHIRERDRGREREVERERESEREGERENVHICIYIYMLHIDYLHLRAYASAADLFFFPVYCLRGRGTKACSVGGGGRATGGRNSFLSFTCVKYLCLHMCVNVCTSVHMCAYVRICVYMCVYVCICVYMCVCVYV